MYSLTDIHDEALLDRLSRVVAEDNRLTAMLLAHIAEVDARRLYLSKACASMFTYCVEVLGFEEGRAYKRIHAARAARAYPIVFELVASGAIHLAGVTLMAPHLNEANHRELLAAARGKSKRAIEEMIAARFPKPDAPPVIRKLPAPKVEERPREEPVLFAVSRGGAASAPSERTASVEIRSVPSPAVRAVTPLSVDRFKVQFTASRELHEKIATAQALLQHAVPGADLAEVFDRSVSLLLEKLLRKKFGGAQAAAGETRPMRCMEGPRATPAAPSEDSSFADSDAIAGSAAGAEREPQPTRAAADGRHAERARAGGDDGCVAVYSERDPTAGCTARRSPVHIRGPRGATMLGARAPRVSA